MAGVRIESTESESSGDEDASDGDNYGKSLQMLGSKTSSWSHIVQSIKNCQTSGQRVDSTTIFLAAQRAFVCDDFLNAIKLFGLAFDQRKTESDGLSLTTRKPGSGSVLLTSFNDQLLEFRTIIGGALNHCSTLISYSEGRYIQKCKNQVKEAEHGDLSLSQSINSILTIYKDFGLEDTTLLSQASAFYLSCGDYDFALDLSKRALSLDPLSIFAQEVHGNLCCHLVERWHFIMLNDMSRNQSYERAIIRGIDQYKGTVSLCDVGCGTGLLSLMASNQLNCKSVYAIEKMNAMAGIARKVFTENLTEENARKIKLIKKSSSQMSIPTDLPHHAQILVTEIFDAGLFGEGILPTLCHAWSNLLTREEKEMRSLVIPSSAKLFVVAIESAAVLSESRVTPDAHFYTLDHSNLAICSTVGMCASEPYTTHDLKWLPGGYRVLSDPCPFMEVDFNNPQEMFELEKGITRNFAMTVTKAGRLDALAMWFSLCLLDTEEISTHTDCHGCWEQAIFPVQPIKLKHKSSLNVTSGDILEITQHVRGAQHLLWVTDIQNASSGVKEAPNHGVLDNDTACLPVIFPEDAVEWCKGQTFCLDGSEVAALNNTELSQALYRQLHQLLPRGTSSCQSHLIHLNSGFSPLCLLALKLGYTHVWAIANNAVHKVLFWNLVQENDIDISNLNLLPDVEELCFDSKAERQNPGNSHPNETTATTDGCENVLRSSHHTDGEGGGCVDFQTTQRQMSVVVLDIVDWHGRLLEDLDENISTIRSKLPSSSEVSVVPHAIDVYGILVESEELLCRSRVVSDERTLGYKIASFVNKFSTRNHQGIVLESLVHTKLCKPFKMFSVDLRKLILRTEQSVSEKDKEKTVEGHHKEDTAKADDQRGGGFEQSANIKVTITASGTVTALVYWFDFHLHGTDSTSSLKTQAADNVSDASMPSEAQTLPPHKTNSSDPFYHLNSATPKNDDCVLNSEEPVDPESSTLGSPPPFTTTTSCVPSTVDSSLKDATFLTPSAISSSPQQTGAMPCQTADFLKAESKSKSSMTKAESEISMTKAENESCMTKPESESSKSLSEASSMCKSVSENIISTLDPAHHWQQAAVMADPAEKERVVVVGSYLNLQCVMGSSALCFRIED